MHTAEILSRHFGTIDALQNAREEELKSIHEIGDEIAKSVATYFHDPTHRQGIERLLDAGIQLESFPRTEPSTIEGKSFVITGTLNTMSRGHAKDLIIRKGGRVASSISRKTDYLVVGESPGSKLQRARDLGITILEENAFLRLLGEDDG